MRRKNIKFPNQSLAEGRAEISCLVPNSYYPRKAVSANAPHSSRTLLLLRSASLNLAILNLTTWHFFERCLLGTHATWSIFSRQFWLMWNSRRLIGRKQEPYFHRTVSRFADTDSACWLHTNILVSQSWRYCIGRGDIKHPEARVTSLQRLTGTRVIFFSQKKSTQNHLIPTPWSMTKKLRHQFSSS